MNEIKCPHCGEAFTIDEAGYAAIVQQVRNKEFERDLNKQIEVLNERNKTETELNINKITAKKDERIKELELAVQKLEAEIGNNDVKTELAVSKAVSDEKSKYEKALSDSKEKITELNNQLENIKIKNDLAVSKMENELGLTIKKYEDQLKIKDETIKNYKDLKTSLSTKMIGETLEKHCENSFNMVRSMAFKNAEFGKDNTVVDGTKGDYIYREKDDDGNEIISIMFEMKNEMDETATKHKNQDFFSKLDKDRKNKKCEYAILVSLLEKDSELYNQGIVDVSYEYEKMYVIRPQFFIPIISILRNAAMNSMEYKRQLADMKNQEIDITHFEERIETFKSGFSRNFDLAKKQFDTAIDEIDKTIDHLKKVKDNLMKSTNNLRLANDKAQTQLTIKALTKDNETMIEMFDELNRDIDV